MKPLRLQKAYDKMMALGLQEQFLKNHPKFAANFKTGREGGGAWPRDGAEGQASAPEEAPPAAPSGPALDTNVGPEEVEAAYNIIRESGKPMQKDDMWAFWRPGNPAYDAQFGDDPFLQTTQAEELDAARRARIKQIAEEI